MAAGTHRILLAEDEKPLRTALELKLTAAGFDVTAVENGEQALALAGKETFDLIITDLIMPRMDGFALLAQLKGKDVPVIVMTNLEQDEDRTRAESLGAKAYIVKSNTPLAQIVEEIKRILAV